MIGHLQSQRVGRRSSLSEGHMGEPARAEQRLSLDMQDIETAARGIAAAEARRKGLDPYSYAEANWPRWAEHAATAVGDLDGERLRRALFADGDIAKALVTAESMAADAAAYMAVLKP